MAQPSEYLIEPLAKRHRRDQFSCGYTELDNFLKTLAGQYARRNLAATRVVIRTDAPDVLGYYSLSATGVHLDEFPHELAAKLPRHETVPAILLARLAVDLSCRGEGLGGRLLIDALERSAQFSSQIAAMAVIVDAIDERAIRFYEHYGFAAFPLNPKSLYLPIDTVKKLFR